MTYLDNGCPFFGLEEHLPYVGSRIRYQGLGPINPSRAVVDDGAEQYPRSEAWANEGLEGVCPLKVSQQVNAPGDLHAAPTRRFYYPAHAASNELSHRSI